MKFNILPVPVLVSVALANPLHAAENAFPKIEIGGAVEIEASQNSPYAGNTTSDVVVATAELSASAQINKNVSANITLLYEEDDTPLEVDVATLTYTPTNSDWAITAGQTFVPFGVFDSNMVSDPFTLDIAETRESAIQLDYESGSFLTSFYMFNGSNKKNAGNDDKIDNFGFNIGYKTDGLAITAGYINDIGDTNGIQDTINSNLGNNNTQDHVAGFALSAIYETGNINVIAEYITANDTFATTELSFNGQGAEPSALNLEFGYGFEMSGMPASLGIAYQQTDEALGLGLAETRLSAALSIELMENTALAFEYAQDDDYSTTDGGTGQSASTITAQLAIEF